MHCWRPRKMEWMLPLTSLCPFAAQWWTSSHCSIARSLDIFLSLPHALPALGDPQSVARTPHLTRPRPPLHTPPLYQMTTPRAGDIHRDHSRPNCYSTLALPCPLASASFLFFSVEHVARVRNHSSTPPIPGTALPPRRPLLVAV